MLCPLPELSSCPSLPGRQCHPSHREGLDSPHMEGEKLLLEGKQTHVLWTTGLALYAGQRQLGSGIRQPGVQTWLRTELGDLRQVNSSCSIFIYISKKNTLDASWRIHCRPGALLGSLQRSGPRHSMGQGSRAS